MTRELQLRVRAAGRQIRVEARDEKTGETFDARGRTVKEALSRLGAKLEDAR